MSALAAGIDLGAEIADERLALAEILEGLPPQAWQSQSLCAGWRVREVVAHTTMPFRYSMPRFVAELVRSGGRFNRMADRCARRDAAMSTDELAAALRDNIGNQWKPPGGGLTGALIHEVIHGLDYTLPLGIVRDVPEARLRFVLEAVTKPDSLKYFGVDLAGVQLRADDLDWSYGAGTPVTGSAQALAAVLCGRTLSQQQQQQLHGDAKARFTT